MKELTGNQVRQMFLDYFQSKGHMIEPGASLIPHNDPTLLWINAGVAALKKYFDGSEKPACNRIANAQKSIRTNDIENVGKTARHHTFFEMLGNFSIGDYFKADAIPFAWEFLTSPEWIGFDKNKLYVTVYPDDEEAYRIWTEVCGVDPSHILKTADNFWEIGEGPGGPDSEIFYDRGEKYDPEGLGEKLFFEEMENDRYIEVWNVVFSQFDCRPGTDRKLYKELPHKNIDTGMGLERLVSIIQEGETNFDTDLFLPIIRAAEKLAKHPYEGEYKMAYRVIADHIRTVTFALSDGAMFSNEGRGYVLRRVLRRAVRYGIKLGINGAFMYKLVDVVADNMKDFYPYLLEKTEFVAKLVKNEEEAFHSTLANGEKLLNEELAKAEAAKTLSGEVVFKLYDTYGFPLELTKEIAGERGYTIDEEGFEAQMAKQRERARAAREDAQSMASQSADLMDFTAPFEFTGYETMSDTGTITGLFKNGVRVGMLEDEGEVILDRSCFYAESGGQVADGGTMSCDEADCEVLDVKKAPHKQFMHHVKVVDGVLKEGMKLQLQVDVQRRIRTMANHSCVHLMQSALKKIVGDHIAQAGSYVCQDYARFDFTHFEKVSDQQLKEVEALVNDFVMAKFPVHTEVMAIEEAKHSGAIALFDEKYGDEVRVVSMGEVSKELCAGTHVHNTQDIGVFKIVSEESIGSGIRRITAKTGYAAYQEFVSEQDVLKTIAAQLKMNSLNGVSEKVAGVLEENAALKKEIGQLNQKMMVFKADDMVNHAETVNGLNIILEKVSGLDGQAMKNLAETLRNKCEKSFIFLANPSEGKVTYVCACSKVAIAKGIKAGDFVKMAAQMSQGNGGGRPDMAQSGGKDGSKVDEVFALIRSKL